MSELSTRDFETVKCDRRYNPGDTSLYEKKRTPENLYKPRRTYMNPGEPRRAFRKLNQENQGEPI